MTENTTTKPPLIVLGVTVANVERLLEEFLDGGDPIGCTHIQEEDPMLPDCLKCGQDSLIVFLQDVDDPHPTDDDWSDACAAWFHPAEGAHPVPLIETFPSAVHWADYWLTICGRWLNVYGSDGAPEGYEHD